MKKSILSLLIAVGLIGSSSAAVLAGELAKGLVGYFPLNGDVSDYSENGIILSNNGAQFSQQNISSNRQSIYFSSGSNLSNNDVFLKNNFSVSFWFNTTQAVSVFPEVGWETQYYYYANYLFPANNMNMNYAQEIDCTTGILVGSNGISVFEHSGGVANADPLLATSLSYEGNLKGWNQATITLSNNGPFNLYINGNYIKSGVDDSRIKGFSPFVRGDLYAPTNTEMSCGGLGGGYNGFLSDVALYDIALNGNQISQLYTLQSSFYTTIPEPSTYALFGIGAIGTLMVMRRKKTA